MWSTYNGVNGLDLHARRFDKAGAPLDAANLAVAVDANYDDRPRVAWDGTDFLVTWARSSVLTGLRMNGNGALLDAPTTLASGTGTYYDFSLASDGLGSLVVSSDYTGVAGSDVKAVKIAKPPAANVAPYRRLQGRELRDGAVDRMGRHEPLRHVARLT